ncbi:hypothetical protein F4808DRAFT_474620 [Astrocystis sublimbata]|nr:hypothetical protein F4808DRAFT_474613 [Astrocystis sublimbata]KAI0195528.1 hypothetical protein F4808DRAFT_474620 [Astrocystis sublimbata]
MPAPTTTTTSTNTTNTNTNTNTNTTITTTVVDMAENMTTADPSSIPATQAPDPGTEGVNWDEVVESDDDFAYEMHKIPDDWLPDPNDPQVAVDNMFRYYERLDKHYTKRGYKPRFRLWSEGGEKTKGFHCIHRPAPRSGNDKYIEQELVYMFKTKEDGKREYKLFPFAEAEAGILTKTEVWQLWRPKPPPLDNKGRDIRSCNRLEDSRIRDKPHLDSNYYFTREDNIPFMLKHCAPAGWKPGEPLEAKDTYKDEDNISTIEQFRPPNQSDNLITGSNSCLIRKTQAPPGIGADWGDYHLFDQWQAHGRKIKLDMVEDKKWDKTLDKIVFVSDDDPTDITAIKIGDDIKERAGYDPENPPMTLREHLLAKMDKRD